MDGWWRASAVGTAQHFRWLEGVIKATLVLNLLDAVLTLIWVELGLAYEKNLFMRPLVDSNAVLFVGAKVTLVSLGMLLLWRLRSHAVAVVSVFGLFVVYYGLLLYHVRFASGLVWTLAVF